MLLVVEGDRILSSYLETIFNFLSDGQDYTVNLGIFMFPLVLTYVLCKHFLGFTKKLDLSKDILHPIIVLILLVYYKDIVSFTEVFLKKLLGSIELSFDIGKIFSKLWDKVAVEGGGFSIKALFRLFPALLCEYIVFPVLIVVRWIILICNELLIGLVLMIGPFIIASDLLPMQRGQTLNFCKIYLSLWCWHLSVFAIDLACKAVFNYIFLEDLLIVGAAATIVVTVGVAFIFAYIKTPMIASMIVKGSSQMGQVGQSMLQGAAVGATAAMGGGLSAKAAGNLMSGGGMALASKASGMLSAGPATGNLIGGNSPKSLTSGSGASGGGSPKSLTSGSGASGGGSTKSLTSGSGASGGGSPKSLTSGSGASGGGSPKSLTSGSGAPSSGSPKSLTSGGSAYSGGSPKSLTSGSGAYNSVSPKFLTSGGGASSAGFPKSLTSGSGSPKLPTSSGGGPPKPPTSSGSVSNDSSSAHDPPKENYSEGNERTQSANNHSEQASNNNLNSGNIRQNIPKIGKQLYKEGIGQLEKEIFAGTNPISNPRGTIQKAMSMGKNILQNTMAHHGLYHKSNNPFKNTLKNDKNNN